MKQIPSIDKYMTAMPKTINAEMPITAAKEIMREYGVRHIPVQTAGRLVGVITDRDIKLVGSFAKPQECLVSDAMTPEPYAVTPLTPLDQVIAQMAEHKYGCAVIEQENGRVVGIFTFVDALRVLSQQLLAQVKTER